MEFDAQYLDSTKPAGGFSYNARQTLLRVCPKTTSRRLWKLKSSTYSNNIELDAQYLDSINLREDSLVIPDGLYLVSVRRCRINCQFVRTILYWEPCIGQINNLPYKPRPIPDRHYLWLKIGISPFSKMVMPSIDSVAFCRTPSIRAGIRLDLS